MDENHLLYRSRALLTQGEYHAASQLLEVLINHNPSSVEALRELAQTRMAQGRPHDAIELLQKVLVVIKAKQAAASDTVFDEQDAHYLHEQHATQLMLREEGTSNLTESAENTSPPDRGDWLLPHIGDGAVTSSDSAIVRELEGARAHSLTQKDPVTACRLVRSPSDEVAEYGPWPFSRKLQRQLAVLHIFTGTAFNRNETSRTATSDQTLTMPRQEAVGKASDHNLGLMTGSSARAHTGLAYSKKFLPITEEEAPEAEDIFHEDQWDGDLFVPIFATSGFAEPEISDIPDLSDRNVVVPPQDVMADGVWEPSAARNDFSDGLWEPAATRNGSGDGLWYEDADEHAIDEFLPPCHEEAELPEQLTRTERARQIAMQVAEDYEWDRAGVRLLTALFERYSWSAAQTAIRRVLEAGTTAQELELAEELRQVWYQRCEFWAAATGGGVVVQRYSTLSWPSSLAIVRSFQGYPQPEEMEAVLDNCLERWSKSVILQRRYPAFFSYALYQCGAHGDMEEYDGWITFSTEINDDDIFDSADLARDLAHQGIRLSARWQPTSCRVQQTGCARRPLSRPPSVTDDNEPEDEGELC